MKTRSFPARRRWLLSAAAVAGLAALLSGTVGAGSAAAPVNTKEPSIKGSATLGKDLTGSVGTWTGTGITYTYRWLRCDASAANCVAIAGETKTKHKLTTADLNSTLRFEVTAASGADKASKTSNPTGVVTTGGVPVNTALPGITGSATAKSTLTATNGAWTGEQPITFTYQWMRCDAKAVCQNIGRENKTTYAVTAFDAGFTIRVKVTGKNKRGKTAATSNPTAVVPGASGGGGGGGGGGSAVDVKVVQAGERLIVSSVAFTPKVVRTRAKPFQVTITVKDTKGQLVRNALVFIRSTPLLTSTPARSATNGNGKVTYSIKPTASFPLRKGYNVQFFVKAYRKGDPVLSGVSGSRLVQVGTAK